VTKTIQNAYKRFEAERQVWDDQLHLILRKGGGDTSSLHAAAEAMQGALDDIMNAVPANEKVDLTDSDAVSNDTLDSDGGQIGKPVENQKPATDLGAPSPVAPAGGTVKQPEPK